MNGCAARLILIAVFSCAGVFAQGHWQLAWSDEFNGAAGTLPDPSKWTYDLGAGGWGNGELETYTNSTRNVYQEGRGNLVIHVEKEGDGYTSARLKTKGLFSFTYGKVEARIQIPRGQGIWPAFWMLGANIDQVNWPQSGEIDIMENIGKEPSIVHGTIHGPGYSGGESIGGSDQLNSGDFAGDFHVYAAIWGRDQIQFLVDDRPYFTVTPSNIPAGKEWVYHLPFFLLLNVAVGGASSWPGAPDATTVFPQDMRVDYVRVYQQPRRLFHRQ
jgi:beta-glucanase (GH16 family)